MEAKPGRFNGRFITSVRADSAFAILVKNILFESLHVPHTTHQQCPELGTNALHLFAIENKYAASKAVWRN